MTFWPYAPRSDEAYPPPKTWNFSCCEWTFPTGKTRLRQSKTHTASLLSPFHRYLFPFPGLDRWSHCRSDCSSAASGEAASRLYCEGSPSPHSSGSGVVRWYAERLLWGYYGGSEDRSVWTLEGVHRFYGSRGWTIFPLLDLLDLHSSPHEKHVTLSSGKRSRARPEKWFQHLKLKFKKKERKKKASRMIRREGGSPAP